MKTVAVVCDCPWVCFADGEVYGSVRSIIAADRMVIIQPGGFPALVFRCGRGVVHVSRRLPGEVEVLARRVGVRVMEPDEALRSAVPAGEQITLDEVAGWVECLWAGERLDRAAADLAS